MLVDFAQGLDEDFHDLLFSRQLGLDEQETRLLKISLALEILLLWT